MTRIINDGNGVPVMAVGSNADGTTPVLIQVDPVTHGINISDGTTGTDHGKNPLPRDVNNQPTLGGVSSSDNATPVEMYGDPATGRLLTKST